MHMIVISHPYSQQIKELLQTIPHAIILNQQEACGASFPASANGVLITDKLPGSRVAPARFKTILLSESERFEEAAAALNAGVSRYLLWKDRASLPKMVREVLQELLFMQQYSTPPRSEQTQALFLNSLLVPQVTEEYAREVMECTGLDLRWSSYTVWIAEVISFESGKQDFEALNYQVYREMKENAKQTDIFFLQPGLRMVGFARDLGRDSAFCYKRIRLRMHQLEQQYRCTLHFGIGHTVYEATQLYQSYQAALHQPLDLDHFQEVQDRKNWYQTPGFIKITTQSSDLSSQIAQQISRNEPYQPTFRLLLQSLAGCDGIMQDSFKFCYIDLVYRVTEVLINQNLIGGVERMVYLMRVHGVDILRDFKTSAEDFLESVSDIVRQKGLTHSQLLISKAKNYIEKHYQDSELSLQDVAQHIFITPQYLSHLFKSVMRISFTEYVTRYRLQKALPLLHDESFSIHSVASEVGYRDSKYFSVCFKKSMGISPTEFRKCEMRKQENSMVCIV